jgi:2-polyprenyl-6-methoxyphenol hydroxylase-like FAD-dependent oxidoreductase
VSDIIVCGAGVIGLAAATMLARDGHRVTVLETDPHEPPASPERAWTAWRRRGVAQFHQPHNLMARFRQVCDQEIPEATGRLRAAGCVEVDWLASPPPTLTSLAPEPDDAHRRMVTGRRPVVEAVFARLAADQPGLSLRRGVGVAGLLTGAAPVAGLPHITGVLTTTGQRLGADLVVDATGRRSRGTDWLIAAGAKPPPTPSHDRGFVYYTRFYTGPTPPALRGRALTPMGSISLLTLHADNNTWSITIFGTNRDHPLRALRDPAVFSRVVAASPLQAHWLDGTPITDVLAMAGVSDRYHPTSVDGRPAATGFTAIGDAWGCTNPSGGRGLSIGIVHAQQLRHAVRAHLDRPAVLATDLAARVEQLVRPFHRYQVATDTHRIAEMAAARDGSPPPPRGPMSQLLTAAAHDQHAFRGLLDTVLCLAHPPEVLARPGVQVALAQHAHREPALPPGPDRASLMALLAGDRPRAAA